MHFLSGWIKYLRIQSQYSQEALSRGICSVSHLSYFENGKKKLRPEVIELLLKKLGIHEIKELGTIGQIRQQFYQMMFQIESYNEEEAIRIYTTLQSFEDIISISPYNIEYKVFQLFYKSFVEGSSYSDLKNDFLALDKIYTSLSEELKYLFMFISGKSAFKYVNHEEGMRRLNIAYSIKETPWINYALGFSCCFDEQELLGTYYFEKALTAYEQSGHYINALWCHNYLGICYSKLRVYGKAETHYKAAITGAKHFNISALVGSLYNNLSYLYYRMERFEEGLIWSEKAMKTDSDPVLPACNHIETLIQLNRYEEANLIFDTYFTENNKTSRYYPLLTFIYLWAYHFDEELFYTKVTQEILPHFEAINYIDICNTIKLKLAEYLENNRRYKEANKIYKEQLLLK